MQLRTRVKICGITSVKDGMAVVNAGADAIGLVFYEPSPRHVEIKQAAVIAKSIPAFVTKTALFVNATEDYIEQVVSDVNIDLFQFHGDETAEFCERMAQRFNKSYIKAVRMQEHTDLRALANQFSSASALLLDAYIPGIPGGTGEQFNWDWIPKNLAKPVILAGGLTSNNVQLAIESASPWAIDVSGGVEQSKGVKSPEKITEFMNQVVSRVE